MRKKCESADKREGIVVFHKSFSYLKKCIMTRFFYDGIPLLYLIFAFVLLGYCWCALKARFARLVPRAWRLAHGGILLLWTVLFVCVLFLSREGTGERRAILMPLWSYKIAFLEGSYDYFQEIYLNVLLFVPAGAALGELFPKRGWLWALLFCTLISTATEAVQYFFSLGLCETDDVISNTIGGGIGAAIGTFAVPIYTSIHGVFEKWLNRD